MSATPSTSPAPRRRTARVLAAAAVAAALTVVAPVSAHAAGFAGQGSAGGKQLIGYFTQWGIYSGYFEKNLITSGQIKHLTELDYAFSDVAPDGTCSSGDSWADYQRPFAASESVDGQADAAGQTLLGNFNQLRELKAAYPKLKIVMAIGGWSWSGQFSQLASTPAGRAKFVASCVDQYIKGNLPGLPAGAAAGIFDGLSIDWEYPGAPGNNNPYGPQDTQDYTALIQEFRSQLDAAGRGAGPATGPHGRPSDVHYLLTADTSANPAVAANLQLSKVAKSLDWFNVMTFDLQGGFTPNGPTDFASNLLLDPRDPYPAGQKYSVVDSVRYYEQHGVAPSKIGIAQPYYAQNWTGVAPGPHGDGLFQPATGGGATLNDNQVFNLPGKTYWDPLAQEPYKYDAASGTFYTYEDAKSLAVKADYIKLAGLRGSFVWSLDGDTSDGQLTAAFGNALGTYDPAAR